MKREDFERKILFPVIQGFISNNCIDFPSSIHTQIFSENHFFIKATEMHSGVNMPYKFSSCNNFAVNYQGVFCG